MEVFQASTGGSPPHFFVFFQEAKNEWCDCTVTLLPLSFRARSRVRDACCADEEIELEPGCGFLVGLAL